MIREAAAVVDKYTGTALDQRDGLSGGEVLAKISTGLSPSTPTLSIGMTILLEKVRL